MFEEELLNSTLPACQLTCDDQQADRIEFIRTSSSELDPQHNEERQAASPNDISSGRQQDLTHRNLLMFISIDHVKKLCIYLSIYIYIYIYIYIFGSMLKIYNTMTKNFMVCLVCLCENRKHLFIGVYGCCGPQKLSVKCGPHKRILCLGSPDFVIRIALL